MSQEANTEVPLRLRRKIALQCTECGVDSPDAEVCPTCRAKANARQTKWRAARRGRRLCVDCGKRSKTRRCRPCKRKGVTEPRRGVDGAARDPDHGFRTVTEVDGRYADGRIRTRYVGRGSRGAPSRAQLEAEDERTLRIAAREMLRAADLVAEANAIGDEMSRLQRVEARRSALSPAIPAARLALAVLRRNGAIDDEAEDTEDE